MYVKCIVDHIAHFGPKLNNVYKVIGSFHRAGVILNDLNGQTIRDPLVYDLQGYSNTYFAHFFEEIDLQDYLKETIF